jgi:iron complex outermembrane receptor protein
MARAIALCAADARAQAAAANADAESKEEAAKKPEKKPAELEQVTVVGIRSGIERAIDIKLESTSIVEAVSAEDIGKLPDVSIAESIARLPGLSAQRVAGRAQVISVRGLSPDFATTLLNGREMVSTGDNRSVEFDQYPSELMSGVTVYKTPDAGLVGQGLSGTINMQTVRPLNYDQDVAVVGLRGQHNSLGSAANADATGNRINASYVGQSDDRSAGLRDRLLACRHADPGKPGRPLRTLARHRRRLAPGRAGGHVLLRRHQGLAPHRQRDQRDGVMATLEFRPENWTSTFWTCSTRAAEQDRHRQPVRSATSATTTAATADSMSTMPRSTATAPSSAAPRTTCIRWCAACTTSARTRSTPSAGTTCSMSVRPKSWRT